MQGDEAARRAEARELRTRARKITEKVVLKRIAGDLEGIAELEKEARELNVRAAQIDPDPHDRGIGLSTSPRSQWRDAKRRRNG